MPDSILLSLQVPTLPEGFCNSLTGEDWPQTLLNAFGQSVAVLNTGSGAGTIVLNQETTPSAEQRGFLWFKPSTGLIFSWDSGGGAWTSPNRSPAGGYERRLFEGTPAQIWAYDGGDGSDPATVTPVDNAGAMWEIDTNYAGRSPMGPGAIPTSNPAKNLALSENFGEGAHTQTETELVQHYHGVADGFLPFVAGKAGGPYEITSGTGHADMANTGTAGGNTDGSNDAANVVHPCRGIFIIKRTQRKNYVG